MLKVIKATCTTLALFVLVPTLANAASARTVDPIWQPVPNASGVYVSFNQENDSVCTWRIRNEGATTLRHLEFSYNYAPANHSAGAQTTGYDLLMSPLKRGQSAGTANQFSVETPHCPSTLVVSRIEWGH